MNKLFAELVSFIQKYAVHHPGCSKDEIAGAAASYFGFAKDRKVFHRPEFAIRFSVAKGKKGSSFSNTIISLSTLQRHDDSPFIVCALRSDGVEFLLANTTFLKKISHTSQKLRVDNIRGSFNASDILRTFDNIRNSPENFETLFAIHTEFTWQDNLERLVERTDAIVPTGTRFEPSEQEKQNILGAPRTAESLSNHPEYLKLRDLLTQSVHAKRSEILMAGQIDNVNLRGNKIEGIITNVGNFHSLEDFSRNLTIGPRVHIDIKTKILTLDSSPKGYNIDKVLRELALGNTVFSFFFVGIDVGSKQVVTSLASIFDETILDATRVQFHWAGRNSRGVTQLTGDFASIFSPEFSEVIDVVRARQFLQELIDIEPIMGL